MFLAPQSPHRYSTPRIIGGGRTADAEEGGGAGAEGPAALPPTLVDVEFMFVSLLLLLLLLLRVCLCWPDGWRREGGGK